jgi:hypothetical protein
MVLAAAGSRTPSPLSRGQPECPSPSKTSVAEPERSKRSRSSGVSGCRPVAGKRPHEPGTERPTSLSLNIFYRPDSVRSTPQGCFSRLGPTVCGDAPAASTRLVERRGRRCAYGTGYCPASDAFDCGGGGAVGAGGLSVSDPLFDVRLDRGCAEYRRVVWAAGEGSGQDAAADPAGVGGGGVGVGESAVGSGSVVLRAGPPWGGGGIGVAGVADPGGASVEHPGPPLAADGRGEGYGSSR